MNYNTLQMLGYRFISCDSMVHKIQCRKHRKKRINKKWLKRYGFKYVPMTEVYQTGDKFIAHPKIIEIIKQQMCLK